MQIKSWMNYLLLLGIGVIWGSQFLLNDIALKTLSPEVIAMYRVVIGAITLLVLMLWVKAPSAAAKNIPMSRFSLYLRYVGIAIFEGIIPFFSVAWGQQYVDSSVSAILVGTVPIFTGVLVAIFLSTEKMSRGTILSIAVGFLGLVVLVAPSLEHAKLTNILAELAILGGSLSFAIALTLIKTMPLMSPVRMTKNILILAAIPMVIYVLLTQPHELFAMNWRGLLAVIGLGVFCSGVVYIMYVTLINRAGATFASLSNYLVPLVGAILGVALLGDTLRWNMVVALVIILGSLGINKLPLKGKKKS